MGVAFDGDGSVIFVNHRGDVINGDAVLLMCARQFQREGRLRGNVIVATVEQHRPQIARNQASPGALSRRRQVRHGGDAQS